MVIICGVNCLQTTLIQVIVIGTVVVSGLRHFLRRSSTKAIKGTIVVTTGGICVAMRRGNGVRGSRVDHFFRERRKVKVDVGHKEVITSRI